MLSATSCSIQSPSVENDGASARVSLSRPASAAAVPVDQIIVYPNQAVPALMLPKGKFRIRAMDKTGMILNAYEKR